MVVIRNWRHETKPGYTLDQPPNCPEIWDHFTLHLLVLGKDTDDLLVRDPRSLHWSVLTLGRTLIGGGGKNPVAGHLANEASPLSCDMHPLTVRILSPDSDEAKTP